MGEILVVVLGGLICIIVGAVIGQAFNRHDYNVLQDDFYKLSKKYSDTKKALEQSNKNLLTTQIVLRYGVKENRKLKDFIKRSKDTIIYVPYNMIE